MATTRSTGYVVTASVWNAVLSRLTDDGVTFSGNFNGGSVAGTTATFSSTLAVTGAATLSSTLAVTGNSTLTGSVGVGAAPVTNAKLSVGGTFSGSGASAQAGVLVAPAVNGVAGQSMYGVHVSPGTLTAADGSAAPIGAALGVTAPALSYTGGGSITTGASLYVSGAATGAASNYAVYVAAGESYFAGAVTLRGSSGDATWQAEAFNAAHYTASGSMSWTVASGDVGVNRYARIGKLVIWTLQVNTSTVGGTPSTELRVTLPGGFTASAAAAVAGALVQDNGTKNEAYVQINASGTYASIVRSDGANWAASTDNTRVWFQVVFEIA